MAIMIMNGLILFMLYGAQVFNEKGTKCYLDQSAVKRAIEFYRKLNNLNKGHTVTSEEFDKGLVACFPLSLAVYRTYKPYPWRVKNILHFEWDCLKMPTPQRIREVHRCLHY